MKMRAIIAAVLVIALAAPVVASSRFWDVDEKHSKAVDFVSRGILPRDDRAGPDAYGARRFVSDADIINAIRRFENMEERARPGKGILRREEFASFLIAGIQEVRELRNPSTTTTTTQPTTTTTRAIPRVRPGSYIVGRDIRPGIYWATGEWCYWERAKNASGTLSSIIANGNEQGKFYVEISSSDYLFKLSCL